MSSLLRPKTVRVFLIQPRSLVAEAMRVVLASDAAIEVVGSAADPASPELREANADLVFIDADEVEEIESAIASCERLSPRSRICVVSAHHRPHVMQRAMAAKADAFVAKDTSPATFVELVRLIANGDSYADPRIAGAMLRRRSTRNHEAGDLSNRELEIVRLVADGLSNREIGQRLLLSEKTVKNHVSHVLAKLKVSARSGIAVYAVRKGLTA